MKQKNPFCNKKKNDFSKCVVDYGIHCVSSGHKFKISFVELKTQHGRKSRPSKLLVSSFIFFQKP